MVTVVTIRPGVQFTHDAANAFRRAEAQVQREFKRNIGVNSTYRSWDDQMLMFNNWNKYVNGTGPYPGHSKAIHPRYSRHTNGTALDSNDWRNARIRQILAENGFIRNQLHVPNEQHHFEYIRSEDKNYGKPASGEKPTPAKPVTPIGEEEDEEMPKNSGVHYKTGPNTWIYLVFNTGSGFAHEFSNGANGGTMPGTYTSNLKAAMDIAGWSSVTESHARVIKNALAAVRPKDAPKEIEVTIVTPEELSLLSSEE